MKKCSNEKIANIYAAYMKAADDMYSILIEMLNNGGIYSPQYDERINAFDKLSHKANRYRAFFPKQKAWYEQDLHLRVATVGEALCDYYLQQEDDIDVWEPYLLRVKALHKELVSYIPKIKSKKNIFWDYFINLSLMLSREFDKREEYEESSKYYSYLVAHGPYGTDDNNRHWVELVMFMEYDWMQARKEVFACKKTCLSHIEKMEQTLSVQRALLRRTQNKKEDECSWIELEILWILEGLAQWSDLHNKRVSYLYDLWRIGKKDKVVRDCIKEDIAAFLVEIPDEKLDLKHSKKRIKVLKELLKFID